MKPLLRLALLVCLLGRIWPFLFIPPVLVGIILTFFAAQCAPKAKRPEARPPPSSIIYEQRYCPRLPGRTG
jgi:hypothetical protein